jgi:multidrug efflux pump subunit AcrB
VYAALAKMKKSFPADVDYKVPFESITIIKVSMIEVVLTLLKALALVGLSVFYYSSRTYDLPLYLFLPYQYLFWVLSAFSYH